MAGAALSRLGQWRLTMTGLALAALTVRWYVVLGARPTCGPDPAQTGCFRIWGDVLYHFTQGRLIAQGHFFKNGLEYWATGRLAESAGDPPLFALLLGAWSAVGFDTVAWQRVLACLLGAATTVLTAMLARRLGGDRAGWIAGAVAAVHPLLWINDVMLMSESLYQPAVVLVMTAAYAYAHKPGLARVAVLGALIAAAALVRGEAVLLGVYLLLPLVMLSRPLPPVERLRQVAVGTAAALAVVAPWIVYNNVRFAEPVTLTATTGAVLMAGSCDSVWGGPSFGSWADCFTERGLWAPFEAEFPDVTASGAERVVYDESTLDAFNRRHAFEYIGDNLGRYPLVMLARAGRTLELYRVGDTLHLNSTVEGRWGLPSKAGLGLYYLLLAPAAAGAWLLRRRGRPLTPLLAMWPAVLTATALTFGLTRYRVPIDIAMVVLASVALAAWAEMLSARFHRLRRRGALDDPASSDDERHHRDSPSMTTLDPA